MLQNAAPPRFVAVTASPSVLIQKGDSVILDCSAVGVPVPIYAWIAPPTVNPLSVSTGTLTVTAVDFSVTGNYNCTALNSVGTVTKSFYVFVFGEYLVLPSPNGLQCTSLQALLSSRMHAVLHECID